MAYHFSAKKRGDRDLSQLRKQLARYELFEFFPVAVGGDTLTLGISIPMKGMDDAKFETELVHVMTYLITEEQFQVTDLFTGNRLTVDEIPSLAKRISG